jgi:hypothetical protein
LNYPGRIRFRAKEIKERPMIRTTPSKGCRDGALHSDEKQPLIPSIKTPEDINTDPFPIFV